MKELFSKELIYVDMEFDTKEEIIEFIYNELFKRDYVKETFLEAILKRETEYPTGLQGEGGNFAIPHTDSKHVNEEKIVFMSLKKGVNFKYMPDDSIDLECNIIFLLAIKNPNNQVPVLMNLMKKLSSKSFFNELIIEKNIDNIYKKLYKIIE